MAIEWKNEPILDSVQLPGSETKYWVADKEAREMIETVVSATHFVGVTTTKLTDGATTNPITINSKPHTAQTGDIVIYTPLTGSSLEFIWDGSKWQLLGGQAIENLGDLAYKNSASGSYTPEGSVNLTPVTTNVVTSVTHDFAIAVTISEHDGQDLQTTFLELSGDLQTSSISYFGSSQALNYVNLADRDNHGGEYHNVVTDVSVNTTPVVNNFSSGALPSISNQNTVTVAMGTGSSSTTLIFSLSDIGFNPGTQPEVEYTEIASNVEGIYASVSFLTLSPNTANIATGVTGTVPIYYSIDFTGNIETTTGSALSGVTATFTGSASTITVS